MSLSEPPQDVAKAKGSANTPSLSDAIAKLKTLSKTDVSVSLSAT